MENVSEFGSRNVRTNGRRGKKILLSNAFHGWKIDVNLVKLNSIYTEIEFISTSQKRISADSHGFGDIQFTISAFSDMLRQIMGTQCQSISLFRAVPSPPPSPLQKPTPILSHASRMVLYILCGLGADSASGTWKF